MIYRNTLSSCILHARATSTSIDPEMADNIYGFTADDIDGVQTSMEKYR